MANQRNAQTGDWEETTVDLSGRLALLEAKLDQIIAFQAELRPFLDMARKYTVGSKTDRLRAVLGHGG